MKCYICSENCSITQTPGSGCRPGRSCYSVHAFDTALNKSVTRKGCIPEFFCTQNRACVFLNQSRSGALRSCSISCCSTPLCNGPPLPTTQPITTTAPPTTTTEPPTTLPTTVPTTVPTTAPTTAPILPGNYETNHRLKILFAVNYKISHEHFLAVALACITVTLQVGKVKC